ncbi:MAG: adenylate/guanylate cyclase domain-containing protein [Gloeobacteraceae cyanobacterium ES-bin-144]|nr:adenylate/guanylate cyclase domain-containing protein [Verrucomicrobiales bacterium]
MTRNLFHRNRKGIACLTGVAVVMLGFGVFPWGKVFIEKVDLAFGDWIIRHSGGPPENKQLVLLGIDEASLSLDSLAPEEIAANSTLSMMQTRFPWDRRVWAEAIDRLASAGAKLIVLDLIFSEPSDPDADAALAAAIQRHPGKVVLASALSPGGAEQDGNVSYLLVEPDSQFISGENTPRLGYVNFYPDPVDGLVRSARYTTTLGLENEGKRLTGEPGFRSLAAEVIHAMGAEVPNGNQELRLAGRRDTGAADLYAPLSVYGIFSDEIWKKNYANGEFFQNKVVMIGPVAPRFHDIVNTPMGPLAGPQMHLQAVACGLKKAFIHRLSNPWPGMLVLGFAALVWSQCIRRPLISVFGVMLIASGVVGIALWVGATFSVILLVTGGLLALGAGWLVSQSYDLVTERLEKGRLKKQFRRFVSRDVADAMVAQPEQWLLSSSGVKRRVVVLFSDVRGFTTRSEEADPGDLVRQLNEYLTAMVEVVFRNGGTLDKFIGDAVMAHWGALGGGSYEIDARKAIVAAREMLASLEQLNAKWKTEGKSGFHIGIGLHLGEVIAGEIGSPNRTEFGVIGDAVNLASRLEGLTKAFSCEVIFSDEVRSAAGIEEGIIDLGLVQVKGRRTPGRLFAIGDEASIRKTIEPLTRDAGGVIVMTEK